MSTVMEPSQVQFEWITPPLKPGGRLEIYRGVPYNGHEGGGDCAILSLSESKRITIELDLDSFKDFRADSPGFWVPVSPGESFFLSATKPSETFTIPAGTSKLSFDCTIFARDDIAETVSGTIIVRVKEATNILGAFKVNYVISPQTFNLTMQSNPIAVDVYFDNGLVGKTPQTIITIGEHNISVPTSVEA